MVYVVVPVLLFKASFAEMVDKNTEKIVVKLYRICIKT